MSQHLTVAQFLFIHARLIDETGGSHGLHDLGLLEAAVARPKATFDGEALYPDLFCQAAALMDSLREFQDLNHPKIVTNVMRET